jgi:hypothetical protein
VFDSLKKGVARIGWSWERGLDLRALKKAKEQRRLRSKEKKAWRGNYKFLTEVKPGHLLFYRNVPERGRVTIAKVTGEYEFRNDRRDFRSSRSCRIVATGRLLEELPPALRTVLKIQGRFYEIRSSSAVAEFSRMRKTKTRTLRARSVDNATSKGRVGQNALKRILGYSYISPKKQIRVVQRHESYKRDFRTYLEDRDLTPTFEQDFVDVRFRLQRHQYLGEIKVTNPPSESGAFRMALGQLLEYRHTRFADRADPILFIDRNIDRRRLELASQLGVAVVASDHARFRFLNPEVHPHLRALFR